MKSKIKGSYLKAFKYNHQQPLIGEKNDSPFDGVLCINQRLPLQLWFVRLNIAGLNFLILGLIPSVCENRPKSFLVSHKCRVENWQE